MAPDTICTGDLIGDPFSVDITLLVICSNDDPGNPQGLQAQTPGGIIQSVFFAGPFFQPGDVVPNELTCSTSFPGYFDSIGGLGNLTVTPP